MCKVLKVSTSGYYNWLKAKVSTLWLYNQKLSASITTIFNDSFKSYGAPRVKVALEKLSILFLSQELPEEHVNLK